jgi:hypothetical protein
VTAPAARRSVRFSRFTSSWLDHHTHRVVTQYANLWLFCCVYNLGDNIKNFEICGFWSKFKNICMSFDFLNVLNVGQNSKTFAFDFLNVMSGNRCQYRNCGKSRRLNPGLAMLSFPSNDRERCETRILYTIECLNFI